MLVKIRWLFIKAGCLIIDFFKKKSWLPALLHKEDAVAVVFFWQVRLGGVQKASQIPKQKALSVKQRAFESICTELNRPAGKGILQGKGTRLLYDCADVNGIIQILAECMLPAF